MEAIIDNPKGYSDEVERLIDLHYKHTPAKTFEFPKDSFRALYPNVYRLFLQISAGGKEVLQLSSGNVGDK